MSQQWTDHMIDGADLETTRRRLRQAVASIRVRDAILDNWPPLLASSRKRSGRMVVLNCVLVAALLIQTWRLG